MKRKIKTELVAFRDEPTGELGLRLEGAPESEEMFAATSGRLIAHDLLEHVNGPEVIGDIGDELEALGAIWYARGQHCDLSRDGTGSAYGPHENVASDVAEMLRKVVLWGEAMPTAPKTRATEFLEDVDDILRYGHESARKEAACDADDARTMRERQADVREFLRVARARMHIGIRKARRKWPDSSAMNTAFWAVADAVDHAIMMIEFEGQRFSLVYDPREMRATCEEVRPDEY